MSTPLLMFLFFILITLGITAWAARRSSGANAYFAAGRRITGWQNGIAVARDYMSAASFLGSWQHHRLQGAVDGVFGLAGWCIPTVLPIVAELLRNAGKYTMADVLAYRVDTPSVRAVARLSTLTVSMFTVPKCRRGYSSRCSSGSGISFNLPSPSSAS
jgi:cation/acetate symporter